LVCFGLAWLGVLILRCFCCVQRMLRSLFAFAFVGFSLMDGMCNILVCARCLESGLTFWRVERAVAVTILSPRARAVLPGNHHAHDLLPNSSNSFYTCFSLSKNVLDTVPIALTYQEYDAWLPVALYKTRLIRSLALTRRPVPL
jgi:hypothetical protein